MHHKTLYALRYFNQKALPGSSDTILVHSKFQWSFVLFIFIEMFFSLYKAHCLPFILE